MSIELTPIDVSARDEAFALSFVFKFCSVFISWPSDQQLKSLYALESSGQTMNPLSSLFLQQLSRHTCCHNSQHGDKSEQGAPAEDETLTHSDSSYQA